jgi:hypothetical protein
MSRSTFEQLRLPVAMVLIAIAVFVLWPRGDGEPVSGVASGTPAPSVIVGEPGGEVVPGSEPPASTTPIPTVPASTETPTPTEDGFTAEVLACRSISGSECNDQLGTLPASASSFTALVRFTDANGGDAINVMLNGPNGTISSGAYTLDGGGAGYYYSTFKAGGLPNGEYTLTATRNGHEVATTAFRKAGG